MVGLVDLVPFRKKVSVSGNDIDVASIPARRIVALLERFPELRLMFAKRQIDPDAVMKLAPEIIEAIIAEGTTPKVGGESDKGRAQRIKEAEEAASELGLGDQIELITEIILVTFPGGFGPLLQKLEKLGIGAPTAAPGSRPPTGLVQDTTLPPAFKDSFNSGGTPSTPSGTTAPDKSPPG